MVQRIASATEEMSATSEEISKDIDQIVTVSGNTSSNAVQVARASARLADLSSNMEKAADQFRL